MAKNKHGNSERGGLQVQVTNGNIEQAIRRLKKKIINDGLLLEIKARQGFTTNTEKRMAAEAASKSRNRRRIAKQNNN
jgi:ribosomal protein S21